MSREGYTTENDARLRTFLREKLNDAGLTLARLDEVCISRIYRATLSNGKPLFVKWGLVPQSPAADFLAFASASPLVPHLVGGSPFVLDEKPVFCFKWIDLWRRRIDQMSDAQFESFLSAYHELSHLMQTFGRASDPADADVWRGQIGTYVRAHPLARWPLRSLLAISPTQAHPVEGGLRVITHGDLHSGNFSFTDDRLTTFLDFDNFVWGSPVDDLAFAFVESARRGEMDWSPTRRRTLRKRLMLLVHRLDRPAAEWRVAFHRIRLTIAAKTLSRHANSLRVAFQVGARDRRIRRCVETLIYRNDGCLAAGGATCKDLKDDRIQ